MRKWARRKLLLTCKSAGLFDRVRDSAWRQQRLLILCYHGLALEEENGWRPAMFITAARLRERFEILKRDGYHVLPLSVGLQKLRDGDLPARSVVLTFDDGTCDFYKLAWPLLREYGFPATVYQTTYYCSWPMPVFPLICSYLLWKRRDTVLRAMPALGITREVSLGTPQARMAIVEEMASYAEQKGLSVEDKNELAAELAHELAIDYRQLLDRRVLQLMRPDEIAELAAAGINFELHTHRHRTPRERTLFIKEIQENSDMLEAMTRARPSHFCYPGGDYDAMFLPWLAEKGIVSATTVEGGIASIRSRWLLLPRFVDTTGRTGLEFESWLTGLGRLLSPRSVT